MENKDIKCPRCGSDRLDSLRDKYGRSKDVAFYGHNDYECRTCSLKFKKEE